MNILFTALISDPLWERVANLLLKEKNFNFIIASHNKPEFINNFSDNKFLDLCLLNDLSKEIKLDKIINIQDYLSPEKYLFLKGIYSNAISRSGANRVDPISQDIKFNKLIIRLLNFLIENEISIIGYDLVPHLPWEIISWELIRALGGNSFCFKRTGIGDAIYIEREIYGDKNCPFFELSKKHPIYFLKEEEEFFHYLKQKDISTFQKDGIVRKAENDQKIINVFLLKIKNIIMKNIISKYIYFLIAGLKRSLTNQYKSYKFASPLTKDNSNLIMKDFPSRAHLLIYYVKYIFSQFINEIYLNKLHNNDTKKIANILKEKYVYFALHLQPESTTFPQSLYWNNIYTAIKTIRENLGDLPIVIKEHPRQYQFDLRNYNFRSINFYKNLYQFKNVFFISTKSNSINLISKSYIVAGISGTNLWESLVMGKPTIMLTEQIHSTMANCISLKNYKSFDKIFNKAEEISGWDGNKKNSSFIKWIKKYSGCFIQSGLYWKYIKFYLDGDYDLGANNIKNAVIDYCEKS